MRSDESAAVVGRGAGGNRRYTRRYTLSSDPDVSRGCRVVKSYGQHCPLASALDLVGDRWTLLIMREVIFLGPRRFTDLARGLPGIAPNLLSRRLGELQSVGLVEQVTLPAPAGSTVYRATVAGEGLREPIIALMRWGVGHMVPLATGEPVRAELVVIGVQAAFLPERAVGVDARYELVLDGQPFRVELTGGHLSVGEGALVDEVAHVRVRMPMRSFLDVVDGLRDPAEVLVADAVEIEGGAADVDRFLQIFAGLVPLTA